ncbi:hypothetical protein [Flaviaesturariibacter terrae]
MDEPFELPVTFRGQDLLFPAQLLVQGYIYKLQVDIYGQEVLFEADEERNFRALIDPDKGEAKPVDRELLQAIVQVIESIVK